MLENILQQNPVSVSTYMPTERTRMTHELDRIAAQCEQAIAMYESKIADLHSQRNACFSRICRVPGEVLEKILWLLVDTTGDGSWVMVQLSQVCRRWRNVVLGCGLLWSVIVAGPECPLERVELLLERAKHCALEVTLSRSYEDDVMKLLMDEQLFPRIHHLHLSLPGDTFTDISPILCQSHPALRSLTLHDNASLSYRRSPSSKVHFRNLKPDMLPALQYLKISAFGRFWPVSFVSATVTHFELELRDSHAYSDDETRFSLVTTLRRMPALEILKMTCIFSLPVEFKDRVDLIPLRRLSDLSLTGTQAAISSWLEHLAISPKARVRIDCNGIEAASVPSFARGMRSLFDSGWGEDFTSPNSLLSATWNDRTSEEAHVRFSGSVCEVELSLSTTSTSGDESNAQRAELHLTLTGNLLVHRDFSELWRVLPLVSVRRFNLVAVPPPRHWQASPVPQQRPLYQHPSLTACMRQMLSLQHLTLDNWSDDWVPHFLVSSADDVEHAPGPSKPPFPDLHTLVLERMSLQLNGGSGVKAALLSRCDHHNAMVLQELRIVDCTGVKAAADDTEAALLANLESLVGKCILETPLTVVNRPEETAKSTHSSPEPDLGSANKTISESSEPLDTLQSNESESAGNPIFLN
ncbi:hypothetical protein EIP91_005448 [Steccherinum ochraceum]|uniref:Uncharacterized protein n=1 Tax=Steccherinum ochraceum TaxID=92696 RepID=A0A4R0RWM2_9APHY|nr:hypothetical protein EIP91_005448 [Steccherinum ochraceum]